MFADGYLADDHRHEVKASVSYQATNWLSLGTRTTYTSGQPYGPWNRRYYAAGTNLGESAQFSPLWPGELLLTEGDRFEWRRYSLPGGC